MSPGRLSAAARHASPSAYARLYFISGGVNTLMKMGTGTTATLGRLHSISTHGISRLQPYSISPVRDTSKPWPTSEWMRCSANAGLPGNCVFLLMRSGSIHWSAGPSLYSATGTAIVGMWLREKFSKWSSKKAKGRRKTGCNVLGAWERPTAATTLPMV